MLSKIFKQFLALPKSYSRAHFFFFLKQATFNLTSEIIENISYLGNSFYALFALISTGPQNLCQKVLKFLADNFSYFKISLSLF